jgi:hypothetical protein
MLQLIIATASGWLRRLVRCSTSSGLKPVRVAVKRPHKSGDKPVPHRGVAIPHCELEFFLVARTAKKCAKQYDGCCDNKDGRHGCNDEQSAQDGNDETT